MNTPEALLKELADASVQGIIILGRQNIEFCNDRARILNDVPRDVLDVGKPWMDFFLYQKDRGDFGTVSEAEKFMRTLLNGFETGETVQVERRAGNGRIVRADRIPNSLGGLTLTLTDITDLKHKEAEVEVALAAASAAEKAKSEFLTNMSHEFRTPMNGVLGMSEMLLMTPLSSEQQEYVEAAQASGNALMALIDDILQFSELSTGQVSATKVGFDIRQVATVAAQTLHAACHAKGLDLRVEIDKTVPIVGFGDPLRLRQTLLNLLSNAVKFTNEGHVVLKLTADQQQCVRFEVSDTGVGIPKDRLEEIFLDFNQANNSQTRPFDGAGLGLTISSALVDLMGGKITVDSIEGEGTQFHFALPLSLE